MKRKASLILLIVGSAFFSSTVFAQKQKKEDEAIRTVVRVFWSSDKYGFLNEQNLRRTISIPYSSVSVQDKGKTVFAFRNKADMEKDLKHLRQELNKIHEMGAILLPEQVQLSHMSITKPNADVAYVFYKLSLKPNPAKKPPVPLLAVLRREKSSWKLVFNTVP